jgi:dolichol-phosphate mannosyltransferase
MPPTIETGVAAAEESASALVVVPAYNEAANIIKLIDALVALPVRVDVLVVDDKSPDGTGQLVREHAAFLKRVFLLTRIGPRGFARSCRDGFQWGVKRGYAVCAQMDADLSHDPADIPRLLATLEGGADLAVGSRYCGGVRVLNWPVQRLLLSLFAASYTRALSGVRLSDPTSGFKAVRTRVLRATDWSRFSVYGYGFQIEFAFQTCRNGFEIAEVPIVFTERRLGDSKMSWKIVIESAFRVFALGCYRCFHRAAGKPAPAHIEAVEFA